LSLHASDTVLQLFTAKLLTEAIYLDGEAERGELRGTGDNDIAIEDAIQGIVKALCLYLVGEHLIVGLLEQQVIRLIVYKNLVDKRGGILQMSLFLIGTGIALKDKSCDDSNVPELSLT
jgi:hypothetical protein